MGVGEGSVVVDVVSSAPRVCVLEVVVGVVMVMVLARVMMELTAPPPPPPPSPPPFLSLPNAIAPSLAHRVRGVVGWWEREVRGVVVWWEREARNEKLAILVSE